MVTNKTNQKKINRRDILKLIGAGLTTSAINKILPRMRIGSHQEKFIRYDIQNLTNPDTSESQFISELPKINGRPNIIFILGDNHNAGIMGCSGHPFIKTPNLDRLADEGVMMGNTFSTTPLCSPSRASILTGFYAHNHGVLNNHSQWNESTPTFLEILSKVGYSTAFIGKWHMPGKGLPKLPFLDLFVSYTYREGQGTYFNCPMIVNGEEMPSRKAYITEEITDYAIEFIQNHCKANEKKTKPFCAFISHRPGHPPYQSPKDVSGMYDGEDVQGLLPEHVDPWWYGKAHRNIFEGVMSGSYYDQYRKYCETLTAMDSDIGRLLDTIDKQGLRDNTVVIYMGDNGMQWGTHNCHGIREPYEDSIKLPFIIRAPWMIRKPGSAYQQIALNIDVTPTLLDIAGVDFPEEIDGKSLVPAIMGLEIQHHREFLLEFWRYFPENTPSYKGIRTERYKYIEFERGRSPWLFDLRNDPGESVNLIADPKAEKILGEMKDKLSDYLATCS